MTRQDEAYGLLPGVRNYNITAKKQGGTLLFLRKIVAGAADDSYGIEVAKLAGVPDTIITKAKTYLRELESGAAQPAAPALRGKKQQKPEPLPPKNAWYFAKTVLAAVLCMAAASGIAPLLFGFLMG